MGQWTDNIVALYQRPALDRILSDIDNVRVAYRWAVKKRKLTALEKLLQTFPILLTYRIRIEGLEMLRLVVDILPEPRDEQQTRLQGFRLPGSHGFAFLERDDEARQLVEKSLALLLPFGNGREIFYAYQFLTQLSYDNPLEMKRFAEAALKCAEEAVNFRWGHIGICQLLSWALAELGEYDEAQRRLDYAVMLCRTDHNLSGETWTYMHLSHLAACQQNWSEAKKWSQQGFAVAEKIGYQYAMAVHQYGLGEIAYHFGNYDEAKLHFQAGLKLAQELGNQKHVTLALEQIREIESVRSSSNLHQSNTTSANPLTERELEVLRLIAEGLSNREIAERQILAISTVKWYINEIFSKLHVTTRTQAVVQARAFGLLA
ncbi:MAG: LuxR C-terminal-related transcriptional regulator [Anaerolineae bacterium]